MLKTLSHVNVWVHDQDEALALYTEKLGFEVREDVTLAELGGFRWLTVGPAGQDDVALALMTVPGPPVFDAETADAVRNVMAKGAAGGLFFSTDDCRGDLRGAQGPGRRVHRGAVGAPVRDRRRPARSVGERDPAGPNDDELTPLRRASPQRSAGSPAGRCARDATSLSGRPGPVRP